MITPRERKAIYMIYHYLIDDEKKHYFENYGDPDTKTHIYLQLRELTYLATGKRNKSIKEEAKEYGL